METLPQTSDELDALLSERSLFMGNHTDMVPIVSDQDNAIEIAEIPFDPSVHDPSHIDPTSIMEDVLGVQHVRIVKPKKSMDINIVLHGDASESKLPDVYQPIVGCKQDLANALAESIYGVTSSSDKVRMYNLGRNFRDDSFEHIPETEELDEAASFIEQIALNGLTFVISSFKGIEFNASKTDFRNTVAIKADHEYQLRLPAGFGNWPFDKSDVDTDKPKKLKAANELLDARHAETVSKLSNLGMSVVQVTYTNKLGGVRPNLVRADGIIAGAIRGIADR